MADGGYDEGYRNCPCFWGNEPGSLVRLLFDRIRSFDGFKCLDAGSGEGKNAASMAVHGGIVDAIEVSDLAQKNGAAIWGPHPLIRRKTEDIRDIALPSASYDIVVAYGLLHCMSDKADVQLVLAKLQAATRKGGYNVVCAFNQRHQDLRAHPEFTPTLLPHNFYLNAYSGGWELITATDTDLIETHPHNGIEHTHSMTRVLAQRVK